MPLTRFLPPHVRGSRTTCEAQHLTLEQLYLVLREVQYQIRYTGPSWEEAAQAMLCVQCELLRRLIEKEQDDAAGVTATLG
jgi:hypothetical protein